MWILPAVENLESKLCYSIFRLPLIYSKTIEDCDIGGHLGAILVGNSYSLEVITYTADAGTGIFLKGSGTSQFEVLPITKPGFTADLDRKSIVILNSNGKQLYIISNDNGQLQGYQNR